jgi:phosphoglucosamine mutase
VLAVVKREGRSRSAKSATASNPLPQILKNVRYKGGQPLETASVISAIASARTRLGASGRLVIRPSGTEPVIRVMAEADDRDLVERLVDDVCDAVASAAAAA